MAEKFVPRDWQERFVRDYQTNLKKNFLVEACTSAGKTGGALYAYDFLRKGGLDLRFLVAVVPGDHLKRQYAKDASNLFGMNLYHSGTDKRLKRLPTPEELLNTGHHGMVVSYQWLTKPDNAQKLSSALKAGVAGKVFVILDEVHHASDQLAFGQACESAFSDDVVAHRLMTSGTPFRSDNNRILGNWINYVSVEENVYECLPDFRYTLANALEDATIPPFSFVTLAGEFTYRRGEAHYEGQTFTNAQSEQELTDALNTAIFVEGDWVKTAIEWAHGRMKRDRQKGLPECATYVRVPTIQAARQMKERILRLTGEDALVVVSKDDDPNARNVSQQDSSKLIEKFASETGATTCSWIIGVAILGEGVSINRLKYRIHATNVRASLSFMQDLGRLLRKFPEDNPEPVETLIPAHPDLIRLALDVMNEVAHVIREGDEEDDSRNDSSESERGDTSVSLFEPLASTGELAAQIADGEEVSGLHIQIAEWAVQTKDYLQQYRKTPAHFAQTLQKEESLFTMLLNEYQKIVGANDNQIAQTVEDIPFGFPSEYAEWLPDEKAKYARKQANAKAFRLTCILCPNHDDAHKKKITRLVHHAAKKKNNLPSDGFIDHKGWERIYNWLRQKIADNPTRVEDL